MVPAREILGAEALMKESEVAIYLRVSPITLAAWARKGSGPKFSKVSNQRRYKMSDIEAWMAAQTEEAK